MHVHTRKNCFLGQNHIIKVRILITRSKEMRKSLLVIVLVSLALAACQAAPAASTQAASTEAMMNETPAATEAMMESSTDTMMESPTEAMGDQSGDMMGTEAMGTEAMGTDTMGDQSGDMMDATADMSMGETMVTGTPDFFNYAFTDVTSGETFTINDMQGKVIVVEDMAQWCPTCLSQQKQIKAFLEQMGMPADLVVISLDIDPNENAATLKDYVATNGFGWHYAVAPADVTREISDKFGVQFLNPPSTPMFIIDSHGEVHLLPFGVKSADDLSSAVQPLLDAGM